MISKTPNFDRALDAILKDLASKRPVFYSEADFQHALAWEIHTCYPTATARLEVYPGGIGKREYIDILIKLGSEIYAIELKHKTRKINVVYNGEEFRLLDQSAHDIGRYDFIKDITRLERFVSAHSNASGYIIMLTNDDNYWRGPKRSATADADFRISEGRNLKGELKWGKNASVGTTKGRERSLYLNDEYTLRWFDYSKLLESGPNQFRYLLLKVRPSI